MNVSDVELALDYHFENQELLGEALTHSSTVGLRRMPERASGWFGYERLEFLGDRVLGLVIAEMLWRRFPKEAEGKLAQRYVQLVRQETLAQIGSKLDLGRHVAVADSAQLTQAMIADVTEAVIAAVYLDGGLDKAAALIRREWEALLESAKSPPRDPKTELQEWAQGRGLALPAYRLVATSGPAHKPSFTVEVTAGALPPATANGASKRQAEAAAAEALLRDMKR